MVKRGVLRIKYDIYIYIYIVMDNSFIKLIEESYASSERRTLAVQGFIKNNCNKENVSKLTAIDKNNVTPLQKLIEFYIIGGLNISTSDKTVGIDAIKTLLGCYSDKNISIKVVTFLTEMVYVTINSLFDKKTRERSISDYKPYLKIMNDRYIDVINAFIKAKIINGEKMSSLLAYFIMNNNINVVDSIIHHIPSGDLSKITVDIGEVLDYGWYDMAIFLLKQPIITNFTNLRIVEKEQVNTTLSLMTNSMVKPLSTYYLNTELKSHYDQLNKRNNILEKASYYVETINPLVENIQKEYSKYSKEELYEESHEEPHEEESQDDHHVVEWIKLFNVKHNRDYWKNNLTGVTTWVEPVGHWYKSPHGEKLWTNNESKVKLLEGWKPYLSKDGTTIKYTNGKSRGGSSKRNTRKRRTKRRRV